MNTFKIYYVVFDNFSSHKVIEINKNDWNNNDLFTIFKLIIWNMIKDESWDWPITFNDLIITKIFEQHSDDTELKYIRIYKNE